MLRAAGLADTTPRWCYETPVTTREIADLFRVSFSLAAFRACPGVLGGSQWNGPLVQSRLQPCSTCRAVGLRATTFSAFRAGQVHPRANSHMGAANKTTHGFACESARLADGRRVGSTAPLKWKSTDRRGRMVAGESPPQRATLVLTGRACPVDFVSVRRAQRRTWSYRFNTLADRSAAGWSSPTPSVAAQYIRRRARGSPSNFWRTRNPGRADHPSCSRLAAEVKAKGDHEDTRRHDSSARRNLIVGPNHASFDSPQMAQRH
jgi:hypothetical protein